MLPPSGMVFFCSSTLLFYIPWCFRLAEDCLLLVVQLDDLCTNCLLALQLPTCQARKLFQQKVLTLSCNSRCCGSSLALTKPFIWTNDHSPMHNLYDCVNYFFKVNFICESVITSCNDTAVSYISVTVSKDPGEVFVNPITVLRWGENE